MTTARPGPLRAADRTAVHESERPERVKGRELMKNRVQRRYLPLVSLVLLLTLAMTSFASTTAQSAKAAGGIIWKTDFEDGSLNAFSSGGGGGEFNSGNADATVSTDVAHSGKRSAKLTISANGSDTGARLHRWTEPDRNQKAYYSAWYYFPQRVDVRGGWWNIMQFKSRTSSRNDPWWIVYVGNRSDGSMYVYLRDWVHKRSYTQNVANLPVGKWVHLEVYFEETSSSNGRVTLWQDGVQLLDLRNVQTGYSGGRNTWGITNYASSLSPSPTTIYVDDAVIATERQGPGSSPAPSPTPAPQPAPDPSPTPQPAPSGLAFQNPTNGATVSGQVTLRVNVPAGTQGVRFWRDNWVWLGSDWNPGDGFSLSVNAGTFGRGQHTIRAWAIGSNDRKLAETVITVTVQ